VHRSPAEAPDRETVLQPADLITAIEVPGLPDAANSRYRKVRDRASYAFALVSVATVLRVEDSQVARVRVALGGVTGAAAAVAVAIYHATGKRVRDLPITLDKLL
jgi:xanthine dehydrogenase YagS FAD-binding subunit